MIGVAVVVEIVMASSINTIEMVYSFMVAKRLSTPDKGPTSLAVARLE